jgi:hypothetical protein
MGRKSLHTREKERQETGKGISVFTNHLGEENQSQLPKKKKKAGRKPVLVQLPIDLDKKVNRFWRLRQLKDDNTEKSHLITEAIQAYIEKLEREGDPFLKENEKTDDFS